MKAFVFFLLFAFLYGCNGAGEPGVLTNKLLIAPASSNIVSLGLVPSTCTSSLILQSASVTQCFSVVDSSGAPTSSTCSGNLASTTLLNCIAVGTSPYCQALSTPTKNISSVIMATGTSFGKIVVTFGSSNFLNPVYLASQFRSTFPSSYIDALVADGNTNTQLWLTSWVYTSGSSMTFKSLVNFTNTQPVAGIVFVSTTSFYIAFVGDTSLSFYTTAGVYISNNGTFGNIGAFTRDNNGRLFVWDLSCSCIKILDLNGNWYKTILGVANVQQIAVSRNHIFVLDNSGVNRYYEDFSLVSSQSSNMTCTARGGLINATVLGGALPYTYTIWPDRNTRSVTTTTIPVNLALRTRRIPTYNVYLDSLSSEFTDIYSSSNPLGKRVLQNPNSDFPTHSGGFSYAMQMVSKVKYGFRSSALINATAFRSVDLWINVGLGGQNFTIDLGNNTVATTPFSTTFYAGDLPNNTWVPFSFDISNATYFSYNQIAFTEFSNSPTGNMVYVDSVVLTPFNTTQRYMVISDFCGNAVTTPIFQISTGNVLQANVPSISTSCSALGKDGNLGYDGSVTANVTGGTGPYTYEWSFTNDTSATISNLGAFQDDVVIFDNGLNPAYSAAASSASNINLNDTTFVHSGTYAISVALTSNLESLVLATALMDATQYSAIEFWVYGGPVAQQVINVKLANKADTTGTTYTLARLIGYPSVPPNVWVKVTYPIAASVTTFTGIIFLASGTWNQPRIWIDDVVLISKSYTLAVTDSTGCVLTTPSISVKSPALMDVKPIINNAKCFGSSDGQVTLAVTGGTPPYAYSWPQSTNNVMAGLPRTTFFVNTSDSKSCTSPTATKVDILHPPPMRIQATFASIQCFGQGGIVSASVSGGTAPFSFVWAGPDAYNSIVPTLAPTVIFDDDWQNWWLLDPANTAASVVCRGADLAFSMSSNRTRYSRTGYCSIQANQPGPDRVVLSMGCIGCVDTTRYVGVQMYVYAANPADLSSMSITLIKTGKSASAVTPLLMNTTINGTIAGWQAVTFYFTSALVSLADYISINTTTTNMSSILIDDIVLLPVKTGTLSKGSQVNAGFLSVMQGSADTYTLTVTDANNCSISQSFKLVEEDDVVLTAVPEAGGKVTFNATGGVPPYTFYIDNKRVNGSVAEGFAAGTYKIAAIDANGCPKNDTTTIPSTTTSSTAMIAGIVAAVAVVVIGISGAAGLFVYRQRQQVVKALVDVEEGERRAYKIDFSAMEVGTMIGAGSFGEVFSGDYKGADVAIKKLKSQQMTKQQVDEFARESAVMVGLRHPNIVLFMGVCLEPANLCIVTELCPRGNLSDILRDRDIKLPYQLLFKMALDTIKGLQFIHGSGFVHRDLKSPNLLVDKYWCIKIADFGLSVAKHQTNDEAQVSLLWTAPEILSREKDCYTYASDIYSFGVIMWELMSKNVPWEGVQPAAITSKVVGGQRPALGDDWDEAVKRVITTAWAQNPLERPNIKQIRTIVETEIIPMVGDIEMGSSTYDNSFANKESPAVALQAPPPQPPFAIVCATVANSTQLWEADPRAMAAGMQGLYDIFKDHALKLAGYEISRDAPCLYGFANPTNAINFCLQTQLALRDFAWPTSLLSYSEAREVSKNGDVVQRGLRVRMAIHWGSPSLRKEANTNRAIYVGPAMSLIAAMPKFTQGGTTILDQDMYNKLMSPAATLEADPFAINPLGAYQVDGKTVHLFKIVPATLKALLDEELETLGGPEDDDIREPWLVDFEDVKLDGVIGKGTFGEVYSATWKGETVAAKKFVQQKVSGQLMLEMRTECAILRKLQHPNIIHFEGMCLQPPNLLLLTELMGRGALANVIYSNIDLPWTRRIDFARQIAHGLAYLHKNDIIHRDVKSSNLLVGTDWTVKIADFGFSRIKDRAGTMTQCGTVAWTAPEIFDGSHYTEKADVYSYAVVLWEMIFRKKPWVGRHAMKVIQTVETGGRLPIQNMPLDTPQAISKLMTDCWEQQPDKRPSFVEVIETLRNI